MSVTRRINAFLDLAEQDVHAAKTLAVANNRYAPYATTFRYPTPGGRIVAAPDPARVIADANAVAELLKVARDELK